MCLRVQNSMKTIFTALLAVLTTASFAAEQEIFAGTGSYGEASFSDQPMLGHQPVTIEVTEATVSSTDAQRIADEVAALANELEASRRSREQTRQAEAPRQVDTVIVERYYDEPRRTYYPVERYPSNKTTYREPTIEPPPAAPPRRAFEPAFRPFRPANQ